jgi:2-keto-4-pentenoate hydratase/2-oxohepta-3-ene-1,7-dioic acid hydratase in catechol pathway
MTVFKYLIRFKDAAGTIFFGEAGGPSTGEALIGKTVPVYRGTSPWDPDLKATGESAEVKELLSPMEDASVIHCVGLNYKAHMIESGVGGIFLVPTTSFAHNRVVNWS